MTNYYKTIFTFIFLTGFFLSCEDEKYEPATITFYPALQAVADEPNEGEPGTTYTITLKTSRVLIEESQVNIRISGNGAGYGYSYVTEPAQLEPGIITLTIPRGEAEATFKFTPVYDGLFEPTNYEYTFTIDAFNNALNSIGQKHFIMNVTDNTKPFFEENNCGTGDQFVERIASGVSTWACSGFGYPDEAQTNTCFEANAYNKGGSGPCDTYLIMADSINGNLYDEIYVNAQVYSRFAGNGGISFKYSTNYKGGEDPEFRYVIEGTGAEADTTEIIPIVWHNLDEINANLPVAGSQTWKSVGQFIRDIPDGRVYIAVHHQGGSTTSSSSWRIDNFNIKGK